jgi:hypothetical protein
MRLTGTVLTALSRAGELAASLYWNGIAMGCLEGSIAGS